jgi:hypothetical protein
MENICASPAKKHVNHGIKNKRQIVNIMNKIGPK